MEHCSYNTNHWPCTYCEAPNPKHADAKCRNEEELYCPLCGEKAELEKILPQWFQITCVNPECDFGWVKGKSEEIVRAAFKRQSRLYAR